MLESSWKAEQLLQNNHRPKIKYKGSAKVLRIRLSGQKRGWEIRNVICQDSKQFLPWRDYATTKPRRSFFIMKAVKFFNERPYICVASSFFWGNIQIGQDCRFVWFRLLLLFFFYQVFFRGHWRFTEHSDIYLQLCMWDGYRTVLIATLVFTRLLLDEILPPYRITI